MLMPAAMALKLAAILHGTGAPVALDASLTPAVEVRASHVPELGRFAVVSGGAGLWVIPVSGRPVQAAALADGLVLIACDASDAHRVVVADPRTREAQHCVAARAIVPGYGEATGWSRTLAVHQFPETREVLLTYGVDGPAPAWPSDDQWAATSTLVVRMTADGAAPPRALVGEARTRWGELSPSQSLSMAIP
jgi:hypothetical protein